jgi:rSAM/selenodomain-associated transferase 1
MPSTNATARCAIAIMAKASEPGRTKTRLVPPLSHEEACAFNTAFIQDVAANILAAARQASVAPYVAFGPSGAAPFFAKHLPAKVRCFESFFPYFGDCLFNALQYLFARGHASAIVVNSDGPTLPTALLLEAAERLGSGDDRAVLGVSEDGGYYLLGLNRNHRRLFEDIAWSSERVAQQTLARAAEIGLPMHVLPSWYDVDDAAALLRLKSELSDGHAFDRRFVPFEAPYTRALMRELLTDLDFLERVRAPPIAAREETSG